MLENIHYIKDIYAVCNVNRFNRTSLVIRDNYGDFYVIDFDLDRIKVKLLPSHHNNVDLNLSRYFLQMNSREGRYRFVKALGDLKIPLRSDIQPRFKIWVNTGNFQLTVSHKYQKSYGHYFAEHFCNIY